LIFNEDSMTTNHNGRSFRTLMDFMFKSHPWHGVPIGPDAPAVVTVYIEIVPADTVKYELDKATGHLKIDRPQRYSNVVPTLYGFLPQTYSAEATAELCQLRTGRDGIRGDGDPIDICVLTESTIPHGDILLQAVPIGGLRMIDGNEADDKIIAVMHGDVAYGNWRDIGDCPAALVDRLLHYFLTYKSAPDTPHKDVEITHVFGREEAHDLIQRGRDDYSRHFADLERRLNDALHE
jgi:inorganic pyrophosphatase